MAACCYMSTINARKQHEMALVIHTMYLGAHFDCSVSSLMTRAQNQEGTKVSIHCMATVGVAIIAAFSPVV